MKVVFAGGGTAGHVQPALATAMELQRRLPKVEVTFLGTSIGLEARLVPESGFELVCIPKVPLPRNLSLSTLRFPWALIQTIRAARTVIADADCVVGFGGYVAAPAYLAARVEKVPIVVHEQNARPGFANRLGARLTSHVAVSFINTRLPHAKLTGLPLHPRIVAASKLSRAAALAHFGLVPDRPVLLVTGGSQGAQRINGAIAGALEDLLADGWQVLHSVGEKNALPAAREHYHPLPFISDMDQALVAADLLIGRSGAVTCAEAAALALPAIFVPLPIGNGEQALNAADAVRAGGAVISPDRDFTSERALDLVRTLKPRLSEMKTALHSVGQLSAAALLVDLIEQAL